MMVPEETEDLGRPCKCVREGGDGQFLLIS